MKTKKQQKKLKKLKSKSSFLIVGLGNPGLKYHETRHNVGFRVIDLLSKAFEVKLKKPFFKNYVIARHQIDDIDIVLVKPLTYMNASGIILPALMEKFGITSDHLLIITDNMDLSPGEIRIKKKGSGGGHNGLASVTREMGSGSFNRLYIGVGRPKDSSEVVDYVLGIPDGEEQKLSEKGVLRARDACLSLSNQPLDKVINEYNRRNPQ